VYKTGDYGKTWTALPVQEAGVRGYAHVIKEDARNRNLLFLGTEFGLWVSIDGGKQWAQYRGSNFPAVAVRDIVIQARESDLVLATHGRGIWIIDDIAPLRMLTPDFMSKDAVLLEGTAQQYLNSNGGWAEGDSTFYGQNRNQDAFITYYQHGRHIYGDLKIEIFDPAGKLVDTVDGPKHRGLNRATWSMHLKPPQVPPAAQAAFGAATGPRVLPGTYTVKLTKGDQVYTSKLNLVLDRRATYNMEDRRAQFDLSMKLFKQLGRMTYAVDAITNLRDNARERGGKLPQADTLRSNLDQLAASADALRSKIVATKEGGAITGEERIREYMTSVYGEVQGNDGRPTAQQSARADSLGRELEDVIKEFEQLTSTQLPKINEGLKKKKLEGVQPLGQEQWEKMHANDSGGQPGAGMQRSGWIERD